MANIKLNFLEGEAVPVPYYIGGEVDTNLLRFLTRKFYYPKSFIGAKKSTIAAKTIADQAYQITYLINTINEVEHLDIDGEILGIAEVNYLNIEYFQLKQVVEQMHEAWEISGQSLLNYVKPFRQYMEFLTSEGVNHNLSFEGRERVLRKRDQDEDYLSHTNAASTSYVGYSEPLIPTRWMDFTDDYKGKVISMHQYHKLWDVLHENDPVYAVMAATMLQTFLRVGGVMQLPVGLNKLNPNWKRYKQLGEASHQNFRYVKKGGDVGTCLIHRETMRVINDEYLLQHRLMRQELYETKYCGTKHAKKLGRTRDEAFLWLNKHGTPVSIKELQKAFAKASEALEFEVTPHFMRHTGATQLLYRWGQANDTDICEAHKTTIHSFLKRQLGHKSLDTTMLYIRTIENIVTEKQFIEYMPDALPANEKDTPVTKSAKELYRQAMKSYREDMEVA